MNPVIASISPQSSQAGSSDFTIVITGSNFTSDTAINFAGQSLPTTFISGEQVTAIVPGTSIPTLSLGGADVHVVNSEGASNSASFAISAPAPFSVADINNLLRSVTVPTIATVEDVNQFTKTIRYIKTYQIKSGDTIQSIAANIAGDASSWMDIVQINNLRWPFISDNPQAALGQSNYSLILTKRANPADTTIYFNGISPFISEGAILFFSVTNPLSDGTAKVISDVVAIEAVEPLTNSVTLESPIFNTYLAGTSVDVLTTSNNSTSHIVGPGDLIVVPSREQNGSFVQTDNLNLKNLYALLGEDISLDSGGSLSSENGDLATVAGIDNLNQAINHRLVTEFKALPYHLDYGNKLLEYIGAVNNDELAVLAKQEIVRTLMNEPRLKGVKNISVTVNGDVLSISVSAIINIFNTAQNFVFQINTQAAI